MTKEAGVYSARGIGELNNTVYNLAQQGFRIISVFETSEEFYHVVAQMETEVVYVVSGSSVALGGLDPVTRDFIKAQIPG